MSLLENKKLMPILVVLIAVGFHSVDIFTEYEITETQLIMISGFLTPFGVGGLVRAGHKSYLATKANASNLPPEDLVKLKEILNKI